jgi:hypothetical protein
VVFRESRVVDEVWAGVAPRALAGEALLIVLDNFEHVPRSLDGVGAPRNTPVEIIHKLNKGDQRRPRRHQRAISAAQRF